MNRSRRQLAKKVLWLRLCQMAVNELIRSGQFKIPVHLAMGHEAVTVAVDEIMSPADKLVLTHRNITYNLIRSGSIKSIVDEYRLKPTGLNRGRSGSMNLADPTHGIVYSSSILGNNFPVAVGVAMGERLSRRRGATIVLGGDGSIEEGSFYESLLFAKSLNLSLVFLIENNGWSLATSIAERRCPIDLAKLASSLGIRYFKLSGNDPAKYITRLRQAKSQAVTKQTPVCVEVMLSTLGDWRGPATLQAPRGRHINYHSGLAPLIRLDQSPILKAGQADPVFCLRNEITPADITRLRRIIAQEIKG